MPRRHEMLQHFHRKQTQSWFFPGSSVSLYLQCSLLCIIGLYAHDKTFNAHISQSL